MLRFDNYMKIKGLNDNVVTIECGLSHGLLSQARSGKSDLGKRAIDKILRRYTDINRVWLLTGDGEMIRGESRACCGRPYMTDGGMQFISVPKYNVEGVVWMKSESVCNEPVISRGDIVAVVELECWRDSIEYGRFYRLELAGGSRVLRIVRKGDGGSLRLLPYDTDGYDEIEVQAEAVERVMKVVAAIKDL